MQNYSTVYSNLLIKPTWAPPSWLFGPVWTILYILITASFGYVFYKVYRKEFPIKVAVPFILNLVFNFLFTPLQFGLMNNVLASLDVALVLLTLAWAMVSVWKYAKWVSLINIPYLLWVSFATILQVTITVLNY
jgi:tryptophan-rich sensory protein